MELTPSDYMSHQIRERSQSSQPKLVGETKHVKKDKRSQRRNNQKSKRKEKKKKRNDMEIKRKI
jgi:hypothetical protein